MWVLQRMSKTEHIITALLPFARFPVWKVFALSHCSPEGPKQGAHCPRLFASLDTPVLFILAMCPAAGLLSRLSRKWSRICTCKSRLGFLGVLGQPQSDLRTNLCERKKITCAKRWTLFSTPSLKCNVVMFSVDASVLRCGCGEDKSASSPYKMCTCFVLLLHVAQVGVRLLKAKLQRDYDSSTFPVQTLRLIFIETQWYGFITHARIHFCLWFVVMSWALQVRFGRHCITTEVSFGHDLLCALALTTDRDHCAHCSLMNKLRCWNCGPARFSDCSVWSKSVQYIF